MTLLQIIHVETLTVYPVIVNSEYEELAETIHKSNTKSLDLNVETRETIFNLLGGLKGFKISSTLGMIVDDCNADSIYWFFYC